MSKRPRIDSHGDELERPRGGGGGGHRRRKKERNPSLGRCSSLVSRTELLGRCCRRTGTARRYLYLVVEDWERGYGIHRVGEDDFGLDAGPIARNEAQHPHSWSFAAHGSKILAMLPPEYSPGIPVLDTETLGMTVWPAPQSRRGDLKTRPLYISVGGRLLSFVYPFVEVLGPPPPPTDRSWSWDSVEPAPPFASNDVTGYAVHPDGRTVFVSVEDLRLVMVGMFCVLKMKKNTFAFDMERLEWTHVGEWVLPFKGPAHYDRELDAWVGLCLYREGGAGRVCCCDVPPAAGPGCETMPAWKLGRDAFFDVTPTTGHRGATLVYMGDSTFCTVKRSADRDAGTRTRVLKMTRFVLKYGKEGQLCTTHHRTYASVSYEIAHEQIDRTQNPVAFWI